MKSDPLYEYFVQLGMKLGHATLVIETALYGVYNIQVENTLMELHRASSSLLHVYNEKAMASPVGDPKGPGFSVSMMWTMQHSGAVAFGLSFRPSVNSWFKQMMLEREQVDKSTVKEEYDPYAVSLGTAINWYEQNIQKKEDKQCTEF